MNTDRTPRKTTSKKAQTEKQAIERQRIVLSMRSVKLPYGPTSFTEQQLYEALANIKK